VSRRTFTAAAIAAIVLAGCSSPTHDQATKSTEVVAIPDLRPLLLDTIVNQRDAAAIERLRLEASAKCLESRGFEVIRPDTSSLEETIALGSTIERIAYGVPLGVEGNLPIVTFLEATSVEADPSNVTAARDYGPAFADAEIGDFNDPSAERLVVQVPGGGQLQFVRDSCIAQSYLDVFGDADSIGIYTQLPLQLQSEIDSQLDSDPTVVAALETWSTCSASQGENFPDPRAATGSILDAFNSQGAEVGREQQSKVASLMRECEQQSGLLSTVLAAQDAITDEILEEHRGELDTLSRIVDRALRSTT
jgi:hypothetical protein